MNTFLEHLLFCFCTFAPNIVYTTLAAILPLEITRRELSSFYSGLIFSSMSLGCLSAICLSRLLLRRCGKLGSASFMLLLQSLAVLLFGLAQLFSNNALFISLSLVARYAEGLTATGAMLSIMLMISTYYAHYTSYFTVYMLGLQIGDLLGPLWGGLLYQYIGYINIFVVQSSTLLLASLLLCYFRSHEKANPFVQEQRSSSFTYSKVLSVQGVRFGLMAYLASESFYISIDPILPFKLARQFGFDQHRIGLFFFHFSSVGILVTLAMLFVPQRLNKIPLILSGCFILTIGTFLTGPSQLFALPNTLSVMTAGLVVSGLGKALIYSFVTAYCVQSGERAFPQESIQAKRRITQLILLCFSLSAFITPLVMSALYKAFDFRTALDCLGLLFTFNSIVFTVHSANSNWGRLPPQREEEEERRLMESQDAKV